MRANYSRLFMCNFLSCVLFMCTAASPVFSQGSSIQVNPDGTHTVIHHGESSSVQVNPDGSHTIIHHGESSSTQINPDGTHSIIHHGESSSVKINPDGSHSTIHHSGGASVQDKKGIELLDDQARTRAFTENADSTTAVKKSEHAGGNPFHFFILGMIVLFILGMPSHKLH